jgi:hypothetical protein
MSPWYSSAHSKHKNDWAKMANWEMASERIGQARGSRLEANGFGPRSASGAQDEMLPHALV